MDISSASIPVVSFVITANMPTRCHQGNEAIPGVADSCGQKPDQTEARFISKRYCKSFAIGRKNTDASVEWHRAVTGLQHTLTGENHAGHRRTG
jgi:hypothetical protein